MLFNSLPFIFGFLPITLFGFFGLGAYRPQLAAIWLAAASLFFYGWWNPRFVVLLLLSVVINYGSGYLISRQPRANASMRGRVLLTVAITTDLSLLGYFKYAGFFASTVGWSLPHIILPLGISFFTFTQIAFLVDVYHGKAREFSFVHYLLFVTYFPHLIAGPILHHKQIMPQFAQAWIYRIDYANLAAGVTIFIIGLAKKVLVADTLATVASPVFSAAGHASSLPLVEAWIGALAYTLQLYFDFSGYSDMAIGASLLFNVRLPLNFNSPYKAENIVDFWRRWHMTLSAFLRDYLYIPLGGNRRGKVRRYANLLITMLLGGLWHGAAWTFVAWGGLHGFYLIVNHGFHALRQRLGWRDHRFGRAGVLISSSITFGSVVAGWVLFRADSFRAASVILKGMSGASGISRPGISDALGLDGHLAVLLIATGLAAVWLLPNTQQFMRRQRPSYDEIEAPGSFTPQFVWQPVRWWAWSSAGALLALCLFTMGPSRISEFIYYQF